MKVWALGAALIPALMGTTAVMAQDATPHFSLSATGGVMAFNLPSGQNGVLSGGGAKVSGTNGQFVLGEMLGFSTAVSLGKVGNYDAFMGVSVFGSYANGSYASTQSFSGTGYILIPGISTPKNGSITLTTSRTQGLAGSAGATANSTNNNPQGHGSTDSIAAASAVGAAQSISAETAIADSFTFAATNTQVTAGGVAKSLAVGAQADTSGNIFLAVGDLDGISISTTTQNTITYSGADITFGASGAPNDKTSVQAYAGPSYRYIGQWNKTNTSLSVDLPEVDPAVTHPIYSLTRDGTVSSNYLGGVVGLNLSHQASDTVTLSVGAEGSIYYTNAHLSGQDKVRIYGGNGVINVPSPDKTVIGDPVSVYENGIAYAVRGQASATMAMTPSMDLTATVTADYLSRVARPYGGANVAYSNDGTNVNASWSSGNGSSLISYGDMLAFGGSLSLTGHF